MVETQLTCPLMTFCRYQIATGAGDDTVRIWDMRSVRALYTIPAHTSNVADVRFFRHHGGPPPAGLHTAPAPSSSEKPAEEDSELKMDTSADGDDAKTMQEWNYRSGLYLASAGYDGFVKIWSADDWQLLRTLTTDSSKVMSVDFSEDAKLLVSGTYNRNFQLFAMDESIL